MFTDEYQRHAEAAAKGRAPQSNDAVIVAFVVSALDVDTIPDTALWKFEYPKRTRTRINYLGQGPTHTRREPVLYSYATPIAYAHHGYSVFVSEDTYSPTTSRHIATLKHALYLAGFRPNWESVQPCVLSEGYNRPGVTPFVQWVADYQEAQLPDLYSTPVWRSPNDIWQIARLPGFYHPYVLARRGRPVAYGVRAWPNNGRVRTAAVDIPAYVERAWHDHARWQPYSDAYTAGVKTYRPTAGLWLVESHNHRQWCESAADAREARAEMVRDICKDYGWSPTLPDIRIAAGDNYRPYPAECYREECRTLNVGNARVAVYTYHYPNAAICPGCTHYTHGPRNRYTGIIRDTRYDDVCPDCIADQDAQDKEG